jgi:hypothetical protein
MAMVTAHILTNSLFFGVAVTAYLLAVMVGMSPRVWGYADYPEAIKAKVPAQTAAEKRLALIVGVPYFIFTLGFPLYSTLVLKSKLGGEISIWIAWLNLVALFAAATLGDLVILDWLIVSRITPGFVIIPGTSREDYKDFSHHFRAHARAAVALCLLALVLAAGVSYL